MFLHQKANHADQKLQKHLEKQQAQKNNTRVTTFQFEISGKNHICSVKT